MKLPLPFMQLPILFDAAAMAAEVAAIEESCWRGRTTSRDANSALVLIAADGDPDSDELAGAMRPTPILQRLPYLMQVLETIGATWGRARLMRLQGQGEVRAHVDVNYYWRERMRVHVPIVTSPAVEFHCGEAVTHMRAGECWIFDTWRRHRVFNGGGEERIHLVADTVGGARFWDLLGAGRGHLQSAPGWRAAAIPPRPGQVARLDFESVNASTVMTPWELKEICVFLLGEAVPDARLEPIQRALLQLARRWQALWSCHSDGAEGWPRFRSLLDEAQGQLLQLGVEQLGLRNEVGLWQALKSYVFDTALNDNPTQRTRYLDPHGMLSNAEPAPLPQQAAPSVPEMAADVRFERPLLILSAPRSGSTLLFETLAKAPDLFTIGGESHRVIEGTAGLEPEARGYDSNRLLAADLRPGMAESLRARFAAELRDRGQQRPAPGSAVRMLEKTPKNALRLPFLDRVFDDARYLLLYRDPREVLASMYEGWCSGRFRTYPQLPGWQGDPWSFLLVPDWRALSGGALTETVTRQWAITLQSVLDDLAALPRERWLAIDYARFLGDPQGEVERVCAWAGLGWDQVLSGPLPLSRHTLTQPQADKWRKHADWIEPALRKHAALVERAAQIARY